MKKIFTLSIIVSSGILMAIANPRDFPTTTSSNSSNHQNSNSNGNNSNHYNSGNSNQGQQNHGNNPSGNYGNHGNSSSNNHNENHNNGSHHYSNSSHSNNYQYPYNNNYHNRPNSYYNRPVIVNRPIYTPRPVIQVSVNRPRPVYYNTSPVAPNFNFGELMYTLRNQRFDSDRLSIARQAIYNNYLDSYQIREVMSVFSFEDSKLQFAKDAYFTCLDKQNYYRINDMFTYSSSIRELEQFIYVNR